MTATQLTGRTAIVTGASRGIGLAIAMALGIGAVGGALCDDAGVCQRRY